MYHFHAAGTAKAQKGRTRLLALLLLFAMTVLLCQALPIGHADRAFFPRGSGSGSRSPSPHQDDSTGLLGDIVRQGTGRRQPPVHSTHSTDSTHSTQHAQHAYVVPSPFPPARLSQSVFPGSAQTVQQHAAQVAPAHMPQSAHSYSTQAMQGHTLQAMHSHSAHIVPTHTAQMTPTHSPHSTRPSGSAHDPSKASPRLAAIGASFKKTPQRAQPETVTAQHLPKLAAIGASFKKTPQRARPETVTAQHLPKLAAIGASLKSGSTTNLPKSAGVAWWKQPGGQPQNRHGQSPLYELHKSYRDRAKLKKALEKASEHPSGHAKPPSRKGGGPGSPGAGGAGQAVSKRGLTARGPGSRSPSPHHDGHSTGLLGDVVWKATAKAPPSVHSSQSAHGHPAHAMQAHPAHTSHHYPAQTGHDHPMHATHSHPAQTAHSHDVQSTLAHPGKSKRPIPGYATTSTGSGAKPKQIERLGAIAGSLKSGTGGVRLPKKERVPWWKQKGGQPQRPDGTGKTYEKDRLYRERKKMRKEMEHLIKGEQPPPPGRPGRPPASAPGGSGGSHGVGKRRLGPAEY